MAEKNEKRLPTIFDIAKAAGVSTATVSRAYNNPDKVRPHTLNRVMKVAKSMGFVMSDRRPGPTPVNDIKRPLLSFIYVVDTRLGSVDSSEIFLRIKKGIENAAIYSGYRLSFQIIETNEDSFTEGEPTTGYVIIGSKPSAGLTSQLRSKPACWLMAGEWLPDWGDHIMPNHREVGRIAARSLINSSCKRVVMLEANSSQRVHRFREEGFGHEIEKFAPETVWRIVAEAASSSGTPRTFGYSPVMIEKLANDFLSIDPLPDGCFIDSDQTLSLVYPFWEKHGILPGRDFKVISCNASSVVKEQMPFDFRSIDVQFELIGRMGVGQVLWRAENLDINRRIRIQISPDLQ